MPCTPRPAASGDQWPPAPFRLVDLRELTGARENAVIRQVAATAHSVWGRCTDEYATAARARAVLRRRARGDGGVVFAMLDRNDALMGTASIGGDDFYDGFSLANGVDAGYVGRDLCTAVAWRGAVVGGLKVWEHLLEARLRWVAGRGGRQLTVFTEPGDIDLPALYGRLGARVLRTGLHHRRLGPGVITMLGYPVDEALRRLAALRASRRAPWGAAYGRAAGPVALAGG